MRKVKVYRVMLKDKLNSDIFYMVDAPNKYIARWCGANLFNNEHLAFKRAKDMVAIRFRAGE